MENFYYKPKLQTTKAVVSFPYDSEMAASQMRVIKINNNNSQRNTVPRMQKQPVASSPSLTLVYIPVYPCVQWLTKVFETDCLTILLWYRFFIQSGSKLLMFCTIYFDFGQYVSFSRKLLKIQITAPDSKSCRSIACKKNKKLDDFSISKTYPSKLIKKLDDFSISNTYPSKLIMNLNYEGYNC